MASASNSFNIVGNISRDIEIKLTTKQTKYCWITVAVNKIGKDKSADFIDVLVWDKMADNIKKYVSKGDCIAVAGTISVIKDKEGHNKIQLTADSFTMLGRRAKKEETEENPAAPAKAPGSVPEGPNPWGPYDVDFPQ